MHPVRCEVLPANFVRVMPQCSDLKMMEKLFLKPQPTDDTFKVNVLIMEFLAIMNKVDQAVR